jgi:tRNA (adenine57-N1/adenine58-N1)-methyltransferase
MSDAQRGDLLRAGELVALFDHKERRYVVRLLPGKRFHTHMGHVSFDDLIGQEEGSWVVTVTGHRVLALRPTMEDYVLEMPRASQPIYPKDLGAMVVFGDIFPGARVVEAGLGSGALTLALLRAVGEKGGVVSYEVLEAAAHRGVENVRAFLPDITNLTVRIGDVYEGIQEREVDRIVLDLAEPWRVIPGALEALTAGGIFLAFMPTALQVHRLVNELRDTNSFRLVDTQEVLARSWHVSRQSLRPDHRMVAHTGFLVRARKTAHRPFVEREGAGDMPSLPAETP